MGAQSFCYFVGFVLRWLILQFCYRQLILRDMNSQLTMFPYLNYINAIVSRELEFASPQNWSMSENYALTNNNEHT